MTQPICVQKDFLSFFYYCYVGFLIKASKFISCLCIFKALRKKFRAYLFQHLVGVEIEGKNNIFIIYNQEKEEKYSFIRIPGLCIKIKGNNNVIKIDSSVFFESSSLRILGDNARVNISENSAGFSHLNLYVSEKSSLHIGKNFRVGLFCSLYADYPGKNLYIGDNCLFSHHVTVRLGDGHRILNSSNDIINNPTQNVVIHNHVWVGEYVTVLKNVAIATDCIVGSHSVVTKSCFQPGCVLVGSPAKVSKQGISWDY